MFSKKYIFCIEINESEFHYIELCNECNICIYFIFKFISLHIMYKCIIPVFLVEINKVSF